MSEERGDTLDPGRLVRFFEASVPDCQGPLWAELIHGGRSNLTYRISDGTRRWVLRRPPLGLIAPTANDVGREYRVVEALWSTSVPVPEAIAFCDDPSVIGAPFSVVSMIDGRVVRSAGDGAALDPTEAARIAAALVDGLATIHAVPYEAVGLGSLGRPTGYLARQIERWHIQWQTVTTAPLPGVAELHARLAAEIPQESATTLVHGDYRIDNTILDADDVGSLAAVVDWEMATLGDPLADLGLMLVYWDPLCAPVLPDGHPIGANDAFPAVEDLVHAYASATARDVEHVDFYRALGYFKLAIIAEGIHHRFLAGLTVGSGFDTVGGAVAPLVEAGLQLLPL